MLWGYSLVGVVSLGSVIPDVFRFIPTEKDMGHSPLIPVLILGVLGLAYIGGQVAKYFLGRK